MITCPSSIEELKMPVLRRIRAVILPISVSMIVLSALIPFSLLPNLEPPYSPPSVEAAESLEGPKTTDIYSLLLSRLKNQDRWVRMKAIDDLWELRDYKNIKEPLLEMLKDEDPGVRARAIKVLGQFKDNALLDLFFTMVDDPHWEVRQAVLYEIGQTNDPRVTELNVRMLKDKDFFVWNRALLNIRQKRDAKAVEPLIKLLNDDDGRVAASAAELLGDLKDPRAVEPLIEALNGRFNKDRPKVIDRPGDLKLRDSSAEALGRMNEKRVLPHLIKVLLNNDEDPMLRAYTAEAIRMIGDPSALGALKKAEESSETGKNMFFKSAVGQAIGALSKK
jgi:HEAT repeat protein